MKQLLKFGLILGMICLAATLVLAVTYEVTKPKIAEQKRLEEERALKQIMPDATRFTPRSVDGIEYFEGYAGDVLAGYCLKVTGSGYGGYIRMLAAIAPDGTIKGISVLEHQETPGLGSKIADVRPGEGSPAFLRQFAGKDARKVAVRVNIDAITGATISSAAVTDAVRNAADAFLSKVRE